MSRATHRVRPEFEDQPWMAEAACIGADPAIFFPDRGVNDPWSAALTICAGCPVVDDCRDYAIDHRLDDGVWGGLTPKGRKNLRRARETSA